MPLLPAALLTVIIILIADPMGKAYPASLKAGSMSGIVENNTVNSSGQHITVSVKSDSTGEFKATLTVPSISEEYAIGDSVTFSALLKAPSRRNSRENDYPHRLHAKGIVYTAFVPPDSIACTGRANGIYWSIRRLQPVIGDILRRSNLSSQACGFLTAILTGDTSALDYDTRLMFGSAGLAHILALSGLHVGVMAAVIFIALVPLYIMRLGKARLLITIVLLWAYAVLTGLSPSVTRAVLMATAMSGGLILQRRYFGFNGLLLAACAILIASPLQLYQPGFQLSFVAVASILAVMPLIGKADRKRKIRFYILSTVAATLAATIGTCALSAYYFHIIPVYFLVANLLVPVLLPLLMGAGVLLVALGAAGIDPVWLCSLIDFVCSCMFRIAEFTGSLPGATVSGIYFSWWICVPCMLTAGALLLTLYRMKRAFIVVSAVMAASTLLTCVFASGPNDDNEDLFLTYDTYSTTCLYRHNSDMYMLTTAGERNAASLAATYCRIYSDYLGRHGADTIKLAPDTLSAGRLMKSGRRLVYDGKSYVAVTGDAVTGEAPPDYAVICRGFRGDVIGLYSDLRPDTVLLSNDLHPRRHDRYADSLRRHAIPFRSLKLK